MTLAKSHTRMIEGDFSSGGSSAYSTRAAAIAATIAASVNFIKTESYLTVGDQGGATYVRVASEPSHDGKLQSSDGAWWEYYADETGARRVNVRAFGAKGDGVNSGTLKEGSWAGTDDTVAFRTAEATGKALTLPRYFSAGNYIISGRITASDHAGLQLGSDVYWSGDGDKSIIVDKFIKGPFDNIFGLIGTVDDEEATDVTLAVGITQGTDTITVNDASLLEPGMWVHVTNHSAPVFNPLTAGVIGSSGDLVAVSDGITSTSMNFTADARFAVNKIIYIGGSADWDSFGTAANNGAARISAVAANKITLTDLPAGWAADTGSGKTIRIKFRDSAVARQGYPAQVYSVNTSTNVVQLHQQAEFNLDVYAGLDNDGKIVGTTLRRYTAPCENINFSNFAFASEAMPYADFETDPTHTDLRGKLIQVIQGVTVNISNVTCFYPRAYELVVGKSLNVKIRDTTSWADDFNNIPRYSIQFGSTCLASVTGHKQYGGRHALDGGANPDGIESCHVLIADCIISGTYGAALGTHHGTRNWVFTDNTVYGSHLEDGTTEYPGRAGFQARGRQHKITNNKIIGFRTGVYVIYSDDQTVEGNDIESCSVGIEVGSSNVANVFNNNIRRSKDHDIYIDAEHRYHSMESLRFIDNKLLSNPSVASFTFESGTVLWADSWRLLETFIPNASSPYSNIPANAIQNPNRMGGESLWYGGTGSHRMKWAPAKTTFVRHVLELRDADFSIQYGSDELVRFKDDEFASYKPMNGGFVSYNQSGIENIAADCNTSNKFAGRVVYDATNNCLATASGTSATAAWHSSKTGVTYAVPS